MMEQFNHTRRILGVAALTLSLTALPAILPASAQSTGSNTTTQQTTDGNYNDGDWGLLGLLGLFGLLGRRSHKVDSTTAYRDPVEAPSGRAPY